MSRTFQLEGNRRGGGRFVNSHKATLNFVSGQVGVTGSGAITGGSGGTAGTYPLGFTGGTVATGGSSAVGSFTVNGSGAVSAINITNPGQYSTAPTGFSFAAASGLTGASATPSNAQVATMAFANNNDANCIPANSRILAIRSFTSSAIAGSPTNVNIAVGNAFQDQSYVANVDRKAQGSASESLVATGLTGLRSVTAPIVVTGSVVGNTTSAGTIEVDIEFAAPN